MPFVGKIIIVSTNACKGTAYHRAIILSVGAKNEVIRVIEQK